MAERGEQVCLHSSFEIHGLRTCKLCRKTLNRDVNAALNMATVGVCQVFGEKHPFRRCGANTDEKRNALLYPLGLAEAPS